jgi:hypothetical protein
MFLELNFRESCSQGILKQNLPPAKEAKALSLVVNVLPRILNPEHSAYERSYENGL